MSGILTSFLGNSGGYTTIYSASLTSGNNGLLPNAYGFINGLTGSVGLNPFTPSGFPALTLSSVVDSTGGGGGVKSYITITGFGTDPGANFLTTFQWLNDAEVVYSAGSGPPGYVYSSGSGTWTFSTGSNVFNLVSRLGQTNTLILKGII